MTRTDKKAPHSGLAPDSFRDLPPLLSFGRYKVSEVAGLKGTWENRQIGKARLDARIGQTGIDLAIEPLNDF